MKARFTKLKPKVIYYSDYKRFDDKIFSRDLKLTIDENHRNVLNYQSYENIMIGLLNMHAPLKQK